MYLYVRARQLEGSFPGDHLTGASISSTLRVLKGWGAPPEAAWPYDGRAAAWPPTEPPGMDALAKISRIDAYERVRTSEECAAALSSGRTVVASFLLNPASWQHAADGRIQMPGAKDVLDKAHSVCLFACDGGKRVFQFANSWGTGWGDRGYGMLPYRYFEKYCTDAFVVLTIHPDDRSPAASPSGLVIRAWGVDGTLEDTKLQGMELFDTDRDELAGWAFTKVVPQGFLDVEELFVRPEYRGRGFGTFLAERVRTAPWREGRSLRAWLPHPDFWSLPNPALVKVMSRLGLTIRPSRRLWSPRVAM